MYSKSINHRKGSRFNKKFKIHAVKLVIEEGTVVDKTERQLDISPKTI
jgi:transposase-like protein